ncbi:putative glycolipid-binding domain-containing protein [Gordonia rubripertincta]|uniref:Glycolipid-binding domain-containing protein n=1 Tax=Gordonia rubripertincta TaxID=36822 RepID=A0AAW4G9U6_GORRU|nr:putative glycolipid-binding domain-containing protein [Gordonia rubripertincta]MBM7280083.1 putative glycolipid-binding domain-containing protein [Gordonia rubripertincta]QMU22096.1 putative glycolipid-binding domain-containing protein [Gordonia rubripertincta]
MIGPSARYRSPVSSPQTAPENGQSSATTDEFKTVLTWRGEDTDRLEQVRLVVSGARVKAYGRIIAAETDDHEAFSASYELQTTESGVTKRLTVHLICEAGETQFGITRDNEGTWLIRRPDGEIIQSDFDGAEDVDLGLSPMFNALPLRRKALTPADGAVDIPVMYMYLPSGEVRAATMSYTATANGIDLVSPLATTTLTLDDNGFVTDYPGLARRV